uniref:Nuclear receptor domain-containing protein n=1 Tax=Meloidogyne javanica TaxID=6303 RepID=A0A915N2S2_MELJA
EKGNINKTNSESSVDTLKCTGNDKEKETKEFNGELTENSSVSKICRKKRAFPTNCIVCGHIASGYVFYNAMCCDGSLKCKSCRFDKCILSGMNLMTLRGNNAEAFLETHTFIKNRLEELNSEGKSVEGNVEINVNKMSNSVTTGYKKTNRFTQIY